MGRWFRFAWLAPSAVALFSAVSLAATPSATTLTPSAAPQPPLSSASELLEQQGILDEFEKAITGSQGAQKAGLLDARAIFFVLTGNYDRAVTDFDAEVALKPDDVKAHAHRALALAAKGDFVAARADIQFALTHDPKSVDALLARAAVDTLSGDQYSAINDFDAITLADPDSAIGHWAKALVLYTKSQFDAALGEIDLSMHRDRTFVLAYLGRAEILLRLKRYPEARDAFIALGTIAPRLGNSYVGICLTDIALKDLERASASCTLADSIAPNVPIVHALRSYVLTMRREFDGALAEANAAISLAPGVKYTYLLRAHIEGEMGSIESELADIDTALRLDPSDPEAYVQRAWVYRERSRFNDALADCNKALALDPKAYRALVQRGLVEDDLRDFEASKRDLKAAIAINVTDPVAFGNLGKTYADEGDEDQAGATLDHAVELDPKNADTRVTRASVDFYRHEFAKAVEDTTFAAANGKESALMDAVEGYSQFAQMKYQAAMNAFRRRLSKDPRSPYAMLWLYLSERRAGLAPDNDIREGLGLLANTWPSHLAHYLLGDTDLPALTQAAATGSPCEAEFWKGEKYLLDHDPASAKTSFQAVIRLCPRISPGAAVASAELAHL
jgi:tetratricopeptide (TPR) repeat protein